MAINLDAYSEEELKLVAQIPIEVAHEYLIKLWKIYQDNLTSERNIRHMRHPEYPGITQIYRFTEVTNKDIYRILDKKEESITMECMDKICINAHFSLEEVTDRAIEWAKEHNKNWPKDYITKYSKERVMKAFGKRNA